MDDIPILQEVQERTRQLTREDFAWAERHLSEYKLNQLSGERVEGTLISYTTKALYVISCKLKLEAKQKAVQSIEALDTLLATELAQQALIASELSSVLKSLFWFQCRSDFGFWEPSAVGLREGWVFISVPERGGSNLSSLLDGILGSSRY